MLPPSCSNGPPRCTLAAGSCAFDVTKRCVEGVLEALTSKVASEAARSHACAVVFISSLPLDFQAVAVQVGSHGIA